MKRKRVLSLQGRAEFSLQVCSLGSLDPVWDQQSRWHGPPPAGRLVPRPRPGGGDLPSDGPVSPSGGLLNVYLAIPCCLGPHL